MKKICMLLFAGLILFASTGCGSEKIVDSATCTKKEEQYYHTVRLKAKDNKVETMGITFVYENSALGIESFKDVSDEQKEKIKESMLKNLGLEGTYEGFSIDVYFDDQMKVDLEIDIEKADKEALKKLNMDFSNTNLDMNDSIKSYKDTGFTCK